VIPLAPLLDTYRLQTRIRALRRLYTLTDAEIDAFMNAYILFDGDWSNDNGKREEQIVDYYNVLNHLCSLGAVEKMYFPPHLDKSVGVTGNQELFEKKMMGDIGARSGARVLDIGCGRGRIAHHVATHSGARVSGMNIDPSQVSNAQEHAQRTGMQDRCDFRRASLNDRLPFEDATFDAAYQVQAFSYAKDKKAVFGEVARVLKPGGRFSYLDWVLLPAFDHGDPEHRDLVRRAAPLLGAVDSPRVAEVEHAIQAAGLRIVYSGNPSIDERQHELITGEDKYFQWLRRGVSAGATVRVLPRYFVPLIDRLMKDADALIEMDRRGLGTTCYQIVCEKPGA
jgi:sterol 24-C-methyltransferase